jgi:TatA/E family protein of Tat protein translocase
LERFDSAPALLYDALEQRNATSMLSIPHLIIIFLVALVVFGPQKLPELARTLGRVMAEFRKATGDLRSTFDEHMRELERDAQLHELRQRDEARARENAQLRAQLEDAGLPTPPAGSLMTPLSPDQLALPGTPRPEQGELALDAPANSVSAPPDTVPRGRADVAADSDPAPDRH